MKDRTAKNTKYVKVFIGRFQPFHKGHLKVLRAAIDTSDLTVVMVGGASNAHIPTLKNPWDHNERLAMIRYALNPAERKKVAFSSMPDFPGDDKTWVKYVKSEVKHIAKSILGTKGHIHYTLVGCHKGADTYYLKLYRGWSLDLIPANEALNATDIRTAYFADSLFAPWAENLPGSSAAYLYAWKHLNWINFNRLFKEQNNE